MRSRSEVFLDTDIFIQHLTCPKEEDSVLLECLRKFDHCFTSVSNIAEVLSGFKTRVSRDKARRCFYGVGLLGIPYRYSVKLSQVLSYAVKVKSASYRDAIVIMMCSETKLPMMTFDTKRYKKLSAKFGVKLIDAREALKKSSGI